MARGCARLARERSPLAGVSCALARQSARVAREQSLQANEKNPLAHERRWLHGQATRLACEWSYVAREPPSFARASRSGDTVIARHEDAGRDAAAGVGGPVIDQCRLSVAACGAGRASIASCARADRPTTT